MWEEIWSRFESKTEENRSDCNTDKKSVEKEVEAYHLVAFMTGYVPSSPLTSSSEKLKHA